MNKLWKICKTPGCIVFQTRRPVFRTLTDAEEYCTFGGQTGGGFCRLSSKLATRRMEGELGVSREIAEIFYLGNVKQRSSVCETRINREILITVNFGGKPSF